MTSTRKILIATIVTLATGFTVYQVQKEPDGVHEKKAGQSMAASLDATFSKPPGGALKSGPRAFLKPRLDDAGKRHLQQGPGQVLTAHASEESGAWRRTDDDLLVAWAALDWEAAMKWINSGEHSVVRAELLGAVAAGILLHDGKDAMQRFLDEHQQDPGLRPKDQGELEKSLFYHLGREDTFDAAMEILQENKDGGLAGMMITGIEGAQAKTNAIDYMEAKGIPVDFDYWSMQEDISKDPRYWADWARQRDSDLLSEIVDGWARGHPDEAQAWVEERVSKTDKRRAEIDELLQLRRNPPAADETK